MGPQSLGVVCIMGLQQLPTSTIKPHFPSVWQERWNKWEVMIIVNILKETY